MEIRDMVPLLNVADARRSIDFYTGVLPFEVAREAEVDGKTVWAMLQHGSVKLMINETPYGASPEQRLRLSYGDVVLYLYVESARAVHAALEAQGLAPGPVANEPYGMEEFQLRDPDGYELAIGSPLTQIA